LSGADDDRIIRSLERLVENPLAPLKYVVWGMVLFVLAFMAFDYS
jgi:hypothetical protein